MQMCVRRVTSVLSVSEMKPHFPLVSLLFFNLSIVTVSICYFFPPSLLNVPLELLWVYLSCFLAPIQRNFLFINI